MPRLSPSRQWDVARGNGRQENPGEMVLQHKPNKRSQWINYFPVPHKHTHGNRVRSGATAQHICISLPLPVTTHTHSPPPHTHAHTSLRADRCWRECLDSEGRRHLLMTAITDRDWQLWRCSDGRRRTWEKRETERNVPCIGTNVRTGEFRVPSRSARLSSWDTSFLYPHLKIFFLPRQIDFHSAQIDYLCKSMF